MLSSILRLDKLIAHQMLWRNRGCKECRRVQVLLFTCVGEMTSVMLLYFFFFCALSLCMFLSVKIKDGLICYSFHLLFVSGATHFFSVTSCFDLVF